MNNNDFEFYVKSLKRPVRLDSLDKLSKEIAYINSQWLKSFENYNLEVDEGDLRSRELDVYISFSKLELTDDFKKRNEDLAAAFICLADTINVIYKIKSIFNFTSDSLSVKKAHEKIVNELKL